MTRKIASQENVTIDMHTGAVEVANQALIAQGASARKLMNSFGITHANPDGLEAEIRGYMETVQESMFAVGARLLLLKTVVEHGDWLARLERIGIVPRAAQRTMQATLKFADPSKPRDKLLGLAKGKLLELVTLDDESLDALEAGGDVLELDLDEVARMSTTELRKKLREARAACEAKDKLLEKRGKDLDRLQEKLEHKFVPQPDSAASTEEEQAQYIGLQEAHTEVLAAMARLAVVVVDIKAGPSVSEAMELAAENAVRHACQRLVDIANDHGLHVDLEELITPQWLAAAPTKGKKASKA
jgi:hypothetical protein